MFLLKESTESFDVQAQDWPITSQTF